MCLRVRGCGCVYVRANQQAASLSVVSVTGVMVKIMCLVATKWQNREAAPATVLK